jgi:alpha-L-fucosidase
MQLQSAFILSLLSLASAQGGLVVNPKNADYSIGSTASSVQLDLTGLVNNRAFAKTPGDANFDGIGSGYPAQYLPQQNFTYSGVKFIFPQYKASGDDNVLAQSQILTPPKGRYVSVHMLAAAETAIATGQVNATYADNTTTSGPILVDPFWDWPYPYGGDIVFPYYLTNSSVDYNRSMIFQTINWLDSTKDLVSLQLPNVTAGAANGPGGASEDTRLHIFAVSLVPATGSGANLELQYARSTQTWFEGTNKTQIVEVTVNNIGSDWVLANNSVKVTVSSDGLETIQPGIINRLRPGDQAIVQVGVVNKNGTTPGTTGPATVNITGEGVQATSTYNATYGIIPFEPTFESIYSHESPPWYQDAKFGIFIHWGVYSVPGWGNVGKNESYAEWYWWDMNEGPNTSVETYQYNLKTYGPSHVYDDFIQNFTAEVFEPKDWVDLFADAGAQYFVQVSKHHDGYAIFDLPENVTERTSVKQYPHRNLLQELFDAAEMYQPQLHRATYFSLPEWFR